MPANILKKVESPNFDRNVKDGLPPTNNPTVKTGNENQKARDTAAYTELIKALSEVSNIPADKNPSLIYGDLGVHRTLSRWLFTTVDAHVSFEWFCNPGDVTWTLAQRSTHVKNMLGTVLHVWPDSGRNTFYDEYILTMRFQSGSLIPRLAQAPDTGYSIPPGLSNFYLFLQLVDAPKLTADGRINLVKIQYKSNIFSNIQLTGMFDSKGVTFSDDSSSPNEIKSWSADFIVYDTSPRFTNNTLPLTTEMGELANNYISDRLKDPSLK
jgi:hypothetical protein